MAQAKLSTSDFAIDRLPPQDIEAEKAVLGSMLLEESAISSAIEIIDGDSFYKDSHKKIFSAILQLFSAYKPVDVLTLCDELKKNGSLDAAGGASYVAGLTTVVPTAAHVLHYAKIVKEKAILRHLITAATEIVQESFSAQEDASVLLDKAERMIFEIATKKIEGNVTSLKDMIKDAIETIDALYQKKGYITGYSTGFDELDRMTSGFQPSELIIIAGRPSMGKSALMCSIAENVGIVGRYPMAIFSLEMSKEHLVQRFLCSHARVSAQSVRSGFLTQSDWPKLTSAAGKLSDAPIFIDDTPGISVLELRAKARRLKAQHDIKVIFLDYLQLMQAHRTTENRQQEISEISRSLKALAREIDVPVVAVSQLSRAPERREDYRPRLSDLRESGAIEQDADLVMLLFREEYYNPQDDAQRGLAEVIIAKQRNGPVGSIKLAFIKEYMRFENLSLREEAEV